MHKIDEQLDLMLHGKFKDAWRISEHLESLGPEGIPDPSGKENIEMWVRHCFNRGWFQLQQGNFKEGSQLLEYGRHISTYGGMRLPTESPIFNPDSHDINGKSIIISLEGGYGDEVIHARFAQSFKNKGASHVYLAASPEIKTVFSRIPGVDQVILRDQAHTVDHDYWVPGFSAGWIAGHTYEDLPVEPYIFPLPQSVDAWSSFLSTDKIKVGIRWAGNPKFEHQQFRKFPPKFLTHLSNYDELQLYSFQKDNDLQNLPENIIDLSNILLSWEDTVAALSHMDLVITSCTSIAHIAAAMGKEVWVMVPLLPYHTWAPGAPESNTSPWYKTVRLFRQQEFEKWNSAFQEMYRALEQKFSLPTQELPNCDRLKRKLQLGCRMGKLDGYLNVDKYSFLEPDQLINFDQLPLPYSDNEFDHIVIRGFLEYENLPLVDILQELWRISAPSAIWELETLHPRTDRALEDPFIKRIITANTIQLFDSKLNLSRAHDGLIVSPESLSVGFDLEVCDVTVQYSTAANNLIKDMQISIDDAIVTMNNIINTTKILVTVHKPCRFGMNDFIRELSIKNA